MISIAFSPYSPQENEAYMNDVQCAHFRSILEKWRHFLLAGAGSTLENMRQNKEGLADEADVAAYSENFRLELRARDRERKLLKKIEQAIAAIKEGDYGFCDDCGMDIGVARLEARPTATKCVDCKTVAEIKEKQWASAV